MATVYFTNNADSGDGSLRAAIDAANPGDIITYDESAFASVDSIVVSLSTVLTLTKEVTIDGRTKRIVLDGQGATLILVPKASVTLKQLDVLRGSSTGAAGGMRVYGGPSVLDRCRLCGCYSSSGGSVAFIDVGPVTFRDCLIAGNKVDTTDGAAIRTHTVGTATLVRCTAVGNGGKTLSERTNGSITVQDSLIQGVYNVSGVTSITPSTAGFVAPCPDTIDPESWNNELWKSWNFRLTSESPYLTGAETVEDGDTDLLGNPRKSNGALGAFEGSWKVVGEEESWILTQNETAEYFELGVGGYIELAGYFLHVQEKAYLLGASFGVTDGKCGYIGCNEVVRVGVGLEEIPEEVVIVQRGADVSSVEVSNIVGRTADVEITKNGTGDYVVLASQIESEDWVKVTVEDGSFTIPTDRAFKVRVFDGDKLLDSTSNPRTYYFTGATTGSFAEKTDWALDAEKTLICNESPTIAGCTFMCE